MDRLLSVADVGIAHDYLLVMRGAERTFAAMAGIWPDAPIYTSVYSAPGTQDVFAGRQVRTSRLQRYAANQARFRMFLPFYPAAFERMVVEPHRVVISSSSAFAHGLAVPEGTTHYCYCHTPFRYAWHESDRALREAPWIARPLLAHILERTRRWDREAAGRVNHYIANSALTRERVRETYGVDAAVIHPPVDVDRFSVAEPEDFFLIVSELVPHKRIDVALEAARRSGSHIKVVGSGPERELLEARFGETAEFLGRVDDRELASLYSRTLALVVAGVEEFGIAAVEANAAGRPVIATAEGGVLETIIDGGTGVLIDGGGVDGFAEAMSEVDFHRFSSKSAQARAQLFSVSRFEHQLQEQVAEVASG